MICQCSRIIGTFTSCYRNTRLAPSYLGRVARCKGARVCGVWGLSLYNFSSGVVEIISQHIAIQGAHITIKRYGQTISRLQNFINVHVISVVFKGGE